MPSFINVSNRLPITITGDTISKSSGGLVSALESIQDKVNVKWIGWSGNYCQVESEKTALKEKLAVYGYEPVFLTKEHVDYYYNQFANSSLWPLLHYMIHFSQYREKWFNYYRDVNQMFTDAIINMAEKNDYVWIHDYHLMLVPSMLRKRRKDLRIGFFLHTPFPSSEIFRCHPKREELLEGLLGADLIGFHTFGYVRHFRSTMLRVLGLESEMNSIVHGNHKTTVNAHPIGIHADKFVAELQSLDHQSILEEYRAAYSGKRLVLSVERMDYTKGIIRRLKAIRYFLNEHPNHDDIVFLFISVPSREEVAAYKTLLEDVQHEVSRINGKFSTIKNVPVHFINQSVNFNQLCALYSLADICMVTPSIDGMNLVAKEYIACQDKKKGVLILSEFAGAAQELSNAIIINPYNVNEMAKAIEVALALSDSEKKRMIDPMRIRVFRYDAKHWVNRFLNDLEKAAAENTVAIPQKALTLETFLTKTRKRPLALFLDYDGTLTDIKKEPMEAYPDVELKDLFTCLSTHGDLAVFIISGRTREDMDEWFSEFNVTLIAEHGFYIKHKHRSNWQKYDERLDLSWMDQVSDILYQYAGMTPGSFVEFKRSAIVWHYRESDPEYGVWKANQLVSELSEIMSNMPVEIHHGKKIVEVSSIRINKGCFIEDFLEKNTDYSVICAGDDVTDESMFKIKNPRIMHIKIGKDETLAHYRIETPKQLRRYLWKAFGSSNLNRQNRV